jgi:hypothetical protein
MTHTHLASTLAAFSLLAGCTANELSDRGKEPLTSFAVAGPAGVSLDVEVFAVERSPSTATYDLAVEGEPYTMVLRSAPEALTAQVLGAAGETLLTGERRGDEFRMIDVEGLEWVATGAPIEIDTDNMAGLDAYAMALFTEDAMTALARLHSDGAAAGDGLGVHTAASTSPGGGGWFIVWRSYCSASCSWGSCAVVCDSRDGVATCGCGFWGGCEATCVK